MLDFTPMILENHVREFRVRYYYIPGYQDAYCVGNDGSLWSRRIKVGWKWIIGGDDDWRKMVLVPNVDGYLHCILCFNGVQTTVYVHRLVADFFIGPCPVGLEVCHCDGNTQNNNLCNLRYDTHLNNDYDKFKHNTRAKGERHGGAVLKQNDIDMIRLDWATGKYTQKQLGEKNGVTQMTIGNIVRNETWVEERWW